MADLQNQASVLYLQREGQSVTSQLFEAYLLCPTKCFLQSVGEVPQQNEFASWKKSRRVTYRFEGTQKLLSGHPSWLVDESPELGRWRNVSWDFAINPVARAEGLEARLHVVQRISAKRTKNLASFVPFRFVPDNKLSRSDKLIAAFDAFALSTALGVKIPVTRVIHGDKASVYKANVKSLSRAVHKTIGKVAALLVANAPPDLILNRHCSECVFQNRCRKIAVEKDDLSLLANLPNKERFQLNNKGIFAVNQLSYTFRPRRRIKRLANRPEKYHHSLKALAIRERKIHVVGSPTLRIVGTPIFFDVEGLPDRDFYYLIGMRLEGDTTPTRHALWADAAVDEQQIWNAFLTVLSSMENPVLIHFGNFESRFLKRMCQRYGSPPEDSPAAKAIVSSVNLLSVIFAQVYFPTYSNGLKEIARFLGFEWSDPSVSGLQSIALRYRWEEFGDPTVREKLITYNADDCDALSLVGHNLRRLLEPDIDVDKTSSSVFEIGLRPSDWRDFTKN